MTNKVTIETSLLPKSTKLEDDISLNSKLPAAPKISDADQGFDEDAEISDLSPTPNSTDSDSPDDDLEVSEILLVILLSTFLIFSHCES